MKQLSKVIFIFAALFFLTTLSPQVAHATLLSCTAASTPDSAQPSTTANRIDFTIMNTDYANSIKWFSITRPFSGITFQVLSLPGWSKTNTGSSVVFTGGSVSPYTTTTPYLTVDTDATGGSGDWVIQASDSTDGSNPTTCTVDGSLAFSVSSSGLDVTPPAISSLSVSGVSASQVTVAWTTDEAATTQVQYGIEPSSYPFNSADTAYATSHSRTLTNLGANTTYYYIVCSVDATGNSSCSDENNFTTAATATAAPTTAATATPTPTPTATASTSSVATATPTSTPFVDRVAPNVTISTEFEDTYENPPLIEGTATDAIGVTNLDYSIDGGVNWLSIDQSDGLNSKSVSFSFTPDIIEDGNYDVVVRAQDANSNSGLSEIYTVIIDRLPPRVGGNLLSLGPLSLMPNDNGVIVTIPGLEQRMTLSAVGGPISIDLLINEKISSLGYSPQTGLWTGAVNLSTAGVYQIRARAIDGAGNKTERDLNKIVVVDPGKVYGIDGDLAQDGEITVYVQNPVTKFWAIWKGSTFGQDNPQKLIDGEYQYFLPPGTYYVKISSKDNPTLTSQIFTITQTRPLTANFTHVPRRHLTIGPISIPLPSFMSEKATVILKNTEIKVGEDMLIGKAYPRFILPSTGGEFNSSSLSGERAVITFISTWSPASLEQMPILDSYLQSKNISHAIITSQESLSKATVFRRRGGYSTEITVDRDGELVEDYHIDSLPVHYFINRRGIIEKIVTGVLTEDELDSHLSEI